MAASPTQASTSASYTAESRAQRNERIYRSLPPLGSPTYLSLLKSATSAELPASVLVRAYRRLHPSPAADATLERLVGHNDRYGYITALYTAARRRTERLDGYSPEDLVYDAIGEIVLTLAGPKGESAERLWVRYLFQCMEEAYRRLVGRFGDGPPKRAEEASDERGNGYDPYRSIDAAGGVAIPWQGRVTANNLEWLESFIERTTATIPDERIRAVALDLFSHNPLPVSSDDPNDSNTLTGRFGVKRFTIYRWQRHARGILRAALERQNEREIDMSFLTQAN
jgi:hypothetical protein